MIRSLIPTSTVYLSFIMAAQTSTLRLAVHAQVIRTIALSGDPAPGTASGVRFTVQFNRLALNNAGQTAFFAELTGLDIDSSNRQGLWSEGSGALGLVARTGDPAPGTPSGVKFEYLEQQPFALNSAGQTAFAASLVGPGIDISNGHGLWSEGSGTLGLVVRAGDPAPGTSSAAVYTGAGRTALNSVGQTAFFGSLAGVGVDGTNDYGIWSEASEGLTLVARTGDHGPGTPAGVTFDSLDHLAMNPAGQTAFFGGLTGSGIDQTNQRGVWAERVGSLELVARGGDQAPGAPRGVTFTTFDAPALNSAGHTAFLGFLSGNGVDDDNDRGIWSESSETLALVAREGDPAPGTPTGVNFSRLVRSPILNSAGQIAFYAQLEGGDVVSGANEQGIWSERSGSLRLVVREDEPAPGTNEGTTFEFFSNLIPIALNSAGQIAFSASLRGSGVDFTNQQGIWAEDRAGTLQLIARTGDLLEAAPGDFRTISELGFFTEELGSGNEDGRPSSFNDFGQLAFSAVFTDGTAGVFVSNLVAVPEPSSLVMLLLVATVCLHRRALQFRHHTEPV